VAAGHGFQSQWHHLVPRALPSREGSIGVMLRLRFKINYGKNIVAKLMIEQVIIVILKEIFALKVPAWSSVEIGL
jgi:hypothetical protein